MTAEEAKTFGGMVGTNGSTTAINDDLALRIDGAEGVRVDLIEKLLVRHRSECLSDGGVVAQAPDVPASDAVVSFVLLAPPQGRRSG